MFKDIFLFKTKYCKANIFRYISYILDIPVSNLFLLRFWFNFNLFGYEYMNFLAISNIFLWSDLTWIKFLSSHKIDMEHLGVWHKVQISNA